MKSKNILTENLARKIVDFFLKNNDPVKRNYLLKQVKKIGDPELVDKVNFIDKESKKWKNDLIKSTDTIIQDYNNTKYNDLFKLFKK